MRDYKEASAKLLIKTHSEQTQNLHPLAQVVYMNELVEMAEEFTETETKQSNFLLKVKAKNARLLKQNQQELTENVLKKVDEEFGFRMIRGKLCRSLYQLFFYFRKLSLANLVKSTAALIHLRNRKGRKFFLLHLLTFYSSFLKVLMIRQKQSAMLLFKTFEQTRKSNNFPKVNQYEIFITLFFTILTPHYFQ